MKEQWRWVVGFENLYQVSDRGRVRSVDRTVVCGNHKRRYKGKILRPAAYTKQGHLSTPLGTKSHGIPVHRLVLEAFVGPCPEEKEVRHVNGKAYDNRLSNLKYGTRAENSLDMVFHGSRKLTVSDVKSIRKRHEQGETQVSLAKIFGVCTSQINNVVHKRHYKQVT